MSLNNIKNTTKKESIFSQFTNQYSLSKTLRFELKPMGNTKQMLEDEKVFKKDEIIHKKYEQTKPFIDRLHREFIKESLSNKDIEGLKDYFEKFEAYYKNKKDSKIKKGFQDAEKELRKQLNNHFKTETLFSEKVFVLLKEKYGIEEDSFVKDEAGDFVLNKNEEKISIFDEWKGFFGYFTKFQETRKNLYKDDGTATAIVTRIIDENLYRFCENIKNYESIKSKLDFSEVENNFKIKISDLFKIDFYNSCLLQEGIDKHNKILGGETLENGEKLKGFNEIINKYRQDNKGEKISFFKMLDKQILSDKEKISFIHVIADDLELLTKLKEFHTNAEEKTKILKDLFTDFVNNNDNYDLSKIYLNGIAQNTIFFKWFSVTGKSDFEKNIFEQNKKDGIVTFDKDSNSYKFSEFLPLGYIKNALDNGNYETKEIWKEKYYQTEDQKNAPLKNKENISLWKQFLQIFIYEFNLLFVNKDKQEGYEIYKNQFEKLIAKTEKDFSVSLEDKLTIKNFVDNTLWIYQIAKYFAIEKKRKWLESENPTDSHFYENAKFGFKSKFYFNAYDKIVKERMLLQSYLTKKPFSTDKWKLNFENPTLADGWDRNKESDNSAIILRKENDYYLAIMKKGNNKIFDDRNKSRFLENIENGKYEKMVYKLLPGASKMLPKVFFSNKGLLSYKPSTEILEIRDHASHTKNGKPQKDFIKKDFSLTDCHKIINFFKESIAKHNDWSKFNFVFSATEKYKDTSDFYSEVEAQGFKINFVDMSEQYIKEKNENGELFLFKIHNKDWNLERKGGDKKTGSKNLHTIYFESLFSEENKNNNFPLKLNGEAELFYRPKTDEQKLGNKKDLKGRIVLNRKRYAEDKTFLHLPITLNRTAPDNRYFNQKINEFLVENPDINIIGLDRGEKHLIYYAGIDQKGNFLKDKKDKAVLGSLNIIDGVNYAQKLEERAKGREKAKQDWQEIEGIKDLKKGYISLVVRKLADLIIEHNAIIVFEDLNMRFKQIRGGIEKSVYQQLEKALIDKLNFLVSKGEKDAQKAGHLLKAFQLTAPITAFKDMGKQTGVIFYTQASYTSKTCPQCGFRPNVRWDTSDIKNKINIDKLKINYKENSFEIIYKLSDFIKVQKPAKRKNILYTDFPKKDTFVLSTKDAVRYKWYRRALTEQELNKGERKMNIQTETGVNIEFNISEGLIGLFEKYEIDYKDNIVEQIKIKTNLPLKFYEKLSFYLHLLTNTRSSVSGTEIDYINCPECNFSSKKGFKSCEFNGDANGAYNIARKGIVVLEKLKNYKKENSNLEKMTWGDLFIDVEEWDKFSQKL